MKAIDKINVDKCIEHLERRFEFDSSGTAKCVTKLISAYKASTEDLNCD